LSISGFHLLRGLAETPLAGMEGGNGLVQRFQFGHGAGQLAFCFADHRAVFQPASLARLEQRQFVPRIFQSRFGQIPAGEQAGTLSDVWSKPLFIAGVDWPRLARRLQVEHVLRVDAEGHVQVSAAMHRRLVYVGGQPPALEIVP